MARKTQLRPQKVAGQVYGSFAGRVPVVPPPPPAPVVGADDSTVLLYAEYDESTKHTSGTQLTTLLFTSVYYQIGEAPPVKCPDVPATSSMGGGHVNTSILFPAPIGYNTVASFWSTQTTENGNESSPSRIMILAIDRTGPEQNLVYTTS